MRCLKRNRIKFYYALYDHSEPFTDEYGNETGEFETFYSDPQPFKANISAATGQSVAELFGANLDYDKSMTLDLFAPPIDEFSVLWIDRLPELNEEGKTDTPHDYIVKKVAKSLNHTVLALKKVNVSAPKDRV